MKRLLTHCCKNHASDGSLTIEASLILPIFLISFLALLSVVKVDAIKIRTLSDLHKDAMREAQNIGTDSSEIVELVNSYEYDPLLSIPGVGSINVTQRNLLHSWTGYINGYIPQTEDIEYVYVTEGSEVYHRSRECTHIRLSITAACADEIGRLRNDSGGRYHSCELCHSSLSDDHLYITRDGDRFHNTLSCSGLKRSVRTVPLSEVGDLRPCKRCGY